MFPPKTIFVFIKKPMIIELIQSLRTNNFYNKFWKTTYNWDWPVIWKVTFVSRTSFIKRNNFRNLNLLWNKTSFNYFGTETGKKQINCVPTVLGGNGNYLTVFPPFRTGTTNYFCHGPRRRLKEMAMRAPCWKVTDSFASHWTDKNRHVCKASSWSRVVECLITVSWLSHYANWII